MNYEPYESELIMLLTTCDDKCTLNKISRQILELRLAACISLQEVCSDYWWEGEINSSKEFQITIKTNKCNIKKLIDKIIELHPYDEPEIIYWPISSSKGYSSWLNNACKP